MKERIYFLDWLRVAACFMVMVVHACECYYIGAEHPMTIHAGDAVWVTLIDSLFRASVPLFVMTSSYLLMPLQGDVSTFFRRRMTRVGIPALVWLTLYAVVPQYGSSWNDMPVADNLYQTLFNFPNAAGHLWFVYMLIGIYLLMPLLSPWLERVSRRGEEIFLGAWLLTTFVPYLRLLSPIEFKNIGLLYGEAGWTEFSAFHYISGFIGYVVLAHYIRTYLGSWSWRRTLTVALPLLTTGYAMTAGWFGGYLSTVTPTADGTLYDTYESLVDAETSWRFCTPNVAMMTFAYFMLFMKITCGKGAAYRVAADISRVSYGMYLVHIFVLTAAYRFISPHFPTPVSILLTALAAYIGSYIIAKLLSLLPGGKYLVG